MKYIVMFEDGSGDISPVKVFESKEKANDYIQSSPTSIEYETNIEKYLTTEGYEPDDLFFSDFMWIEIIE